MQILCAEGKRVYANISRRCLWPVCCGIGSLLVRLHRVQNFDAIYTVSRVKVGGRAPENGGAAGGPRGGRAPIFSKRMLLHAPVVELHIRKNNGKEWQALHAPWKQARQTMLQRGGRALVPVSSI